MKLKVEIERLENFVTVKVLEQSENLRNIGGIISRNGYAILSLTKPQIKDKSLYIGGFLKEYDNNAKQYKFPSTELAVKWVINIRELINKINGEENLPVNVSLEIEKKYRNERYSLSVLRYTDYILVKVWDSPSSDFVIAEYRIKKSGDDVVTEEYVGENIKQFGFIVGKIQLTKKEIAEKFDYTIDSFEILD